MKKLTIWFVDDDDEMRQAISLMLTMLEHNMRGFPHARAAARALMSGERPDLLLLDISMPEVSGVDMLEFIRRRPEWKSLPVLMLSSEATDVQVDEALGLGADDFVTKPVTIDELESAIARAIKKYNL